MDLATLVQMLRGQQGPDASQDPNAAALAGALRAPPEHLAPTEEQAYAGTLGSPGSGLTLDDLRALPGRLFGHMSLPNPINVARDTYRGLSNADPIEEMRLNLPGDVYTGKVNPLSDEGLGKATDLAAMSMGGGMAGAGAADGVVLGSGPVKRGGYKRMTDVPDIRGLPVDEAVAIARKEPHLIPAGDQSEGYFVGGPRDINSKRGLNKKRREIDEYIAADPEGGDWYDRFRASLNEVSGGDPVRNEWNSKIHGQFSAGVDPGSEAQFSIREKNALIAGEPVKAARPAQHEALLRAAEANDPNLLQLGDKTGEYAYKINPDSAADAAGATGVNDFRNAQLHGMKEPDGSPQRNALTEAQHRYLDYENALAVDRANKANLNGRSDWTGEQIQAAPWVRQKALAIQERAGFQKPQPSMMGHNGGPPLDEAPVPKLSYEDAFKRANTTFGDYFDKHGVAATHEAIPGAMTDHLPGMVGSDDATRAAYSADPRSSWANAPGERDAIYSGMGVPGTGIYMDVRPTIANQGIYTPPGGALEANPGATARPLAAFEVGDGGTKSVAPADRKLLNAGEALRAAVDGQGAGAWHKTWAGGRAGDSTSLFMPMDGKATPEQMLAVRTAAEKYGLGDVSDTGRGITSTSFYPEVPVGGEEGKEFAKALAKGLKGGLAEELQGITGSRPQRVKMKPGVDSGYIGYEDKWTEGVGSGAVTREMLSHINATPEIRATLDQNPYLAQNALARLERDTEWAKTMGPVRQDLQNLRAVIAEGPGWIGKLEGALKTGAISLPVVAAFFAAAQDGAAPAPGQ